MLQNACWQSSCQHLLGFERYEFVISEQLDECPGRFSRVLFCYLQSLSRREIYLEGTHYYRLFIHIYHRKSIVAPPSKRWESFIDISHNAGCFCHFVFLVETLRIPRLTDLGLRNDNATASGVALIGGMSMVKPSSSTPRLGLFFLFTTALSLGYRRHLIGDRSSQSSSL